jgi:hypothetical protein
MARNDSSISFKAFGLLSYIMGLPENWDINVEHLVSVRPDGRTAIYSALNELIEAGYVVRHRRYQDGKIATIDYYVSDEKEFDEDLLANAYNPKSPKPENRKPENRKPTFRKPESSFPKFRKSATINKEDSNTYSNKEIISDFFYKKSDLNPIDEKKEEAAFAADVSLHDSLHEQLIIQPEEQPAAAAKKNRSAAAKKNKAAAAKNLADPAHQSFVDTFDQRYQQFFAERFLWQPKEFAAIKKLLPMLRKIWAEKTGTSPELISAGQIEKTVNVFCDRIERDQWLVKNYSPAGILANINKIITNGKTQSGAATGGAKNNNFGGFASKQLLDEVLAITGAASADFDLDTELERLRKEYRPNSIDHRS